MFAKYVQEEKKVNSHCESDLLLGRRTNEFCGAGIRHPLVYLLVLRHFVRYRLPFWTKDWVSWGHTLEHFDGCSVFSFHLLCSVSVDLSCPSYFRPILVVPLCLTLSSYCFLLLLCLAFGCGFSIWSSFLWPWASLSVSETFALHYFLGSDGWRPCGLLLGVVWLPSFVLVGLFVLFVFFWALLFSLFWCVVLVWCCLHRPVVRKLAMAGCQRNVLDWWMWCTRFRLSSCGRWLVPRTKRSCWRLQLSAHRTELPQSIE